MNNKVDLVFGILGKPLIKDEENMLLNDYDMSEVHHKILR